MFVFHYSVATYAKNTMIYYNSVKQISVNSLYDEILRKCFIYLTL